MKQTHGMNDDKGAAGFGAGDPAQAETSLAAAHITGGRRRRSAGFTLIELVVVITILAILAAAALPKFAALQADARQAKMNGALAALKAASAMAHAELIARGMAANRTITPADMAATANPIVIEGTIVGYVNGYPRAEQIAELAGITAPDFFVPATTVVGGVTSQAVAPDANHDGTGGNPACTVVYSEAQPNLQPVYVVNATPASCQ